MKRLLKHLEIHMDNFKIKKKFYIFYILCVLLPLVLTDSVVIYIVLHSNRYLGVMRWKTQQTQYSIA